MSLLEYKKVEGVVRMLAYSVPDSLLVREIVMVVKQNYYTPRIYICWPALLSIGRRRVERGSVFMRGGDNLVRE